MRPNTLWMVMLWGFTSLFAGHVIQAQTRSDTVAMIVSCTILTVGFVINTYYERKADQGSSDHE